MDSTVAFVLQMLLNAKSIIEETGCLSNGASIDLAELCEKIESGHYDLCE